MTAAWVVVADATRARIFSAEKPASALTEIQTLMNPEARLHEGNLTSDKSGRDRNSGSGSHDMGREVDAKQEESIRFAGEVSKAIETGRTTGAFKRLHIIAAPAFLGLLRKGHSSTTRQLIATEIDKNLGTQDAAEIRKQLPQYL